MYSEERGIFKPSLKTHAMTNDVSIKRFSFTQHSRRQENVQYNSNNERINNEQFLYPSLQQSIQAFSKDFNKDQAKQAQKEIKYPSLINQSQSDLTATKFDPILPKILFKRFISNQQVPITQSKRQNSQIIQELKVRNINYPVEVQKLTKQAEDKKILYFRNNQMKQNSLQTQNTWRQNSYRQSVNQHISTGLRKMPYFPLMGTDGKIFWSHSADKLILWKYRGSQIYNPDVFCILNFEQQSAPLTAVYATHVMSPLFKNRNIILIAVAFFNQMQFYSFDIEKYETQSLKKIPLSEQIEDIFKKYVQKILVKVNSNFFIEKILIQNVKTLQGPNYQTNPLILFTDGSRDLQIVDLSNISAFKSHSQYNFLARRQKIKMNKNQNEIIKLLHCRDYICPQIHYAFVLRKQTSMNQVKPTSLIQKIKNFLTFTKKYEKSEQMILSIYEWNENELKNETLWKKIWNPPRVKKIKEISSKDLQLRLKQNFFQFFRLNANSQFFISDISLVEKQKSYSIFQGYQSSSCFLKVTFINGTSVMISNYKTLAFVSKVMVNPYIENSIPILSCQYKNYRGLLQKGHYLQTHKEIKNKFNLYIYEPIDIEKQAKYSSIDPVLSESNGLMICEQKLMYQNDEQIAYKFQDCNSRKRINEVELNAMGQKKRFMIFQNSFITLVENPNLAENMLVLGYLLERHSSGKDKIQSYVKSLIEDMSENSRVSFLKSIIQILILIINSGKKTQSNSPNRMILEDIVRDFYGRDKRLDIDDTTYVEDKDHYKPSTEQVYGYDCQIGKESYQNFVQYLLGGEIAKKQKQSLKQKSSSYNGKNFQLKITQNTVNFLFDILIEQSLIVIPLKPIVKPFKSASMNQFYEKYDMNQENYLRNLLEGMNEVHESYFGASVSKFIVDLIRPLVNLSYESFHHIKPGTTNTLQILDLLHDFIDKFVRFCSFKNYQSIPFTETVLFMKSLQNSLPKFSLLLRLFDTLSEVHFYNQSSVNTNHKSHLNTDWKNRLTLMNFLFKLNQKESLSKMAVEMLFQENAVFLDEIQSKLPQLNEIKHLRYFKGWKKINQKILGGDRSQNNRNKPTESSQVFGFFNSLNKEKSSKLISPLLPFENEQRSLQEAKMRQKEEFLQIQKALNEHSFEDLQRYFLNKNQFFNFAQIVLSKINYLQIIYLQLKNKYHFQDGVYDTFESFTSNLVQKTVTSTLPLHRINKPYQNRQKSQISSFLKYEQRIYNHQKYLKTYQLIKFLNSGLSNFIEKALKIYSQQTKKSEKQLLSGVNSNNIKTTILIQFNHYQAHNNNDFIYFLGQQIKKVFDLLMEKGSQFIKNQLLNKVRTSPSLQTFLNKYKHLLKQKSGKPQQFVEFYDDKNYLVQDQPKPLTPQEQQQIIFENERKKMYLQKIEQKISIESREPYKIQNDIDWMQRHNKNSSLNFSNQQF